jgi:AraC-like DNA-binding protein
VRAQLRPAVSLQSGGQTVILARIVNYRSDLVPPGERPSTYEGALRSYFSRFASQVDVEIEARRPENFSARLEELSLGRLPGAIHASNAPHTLHAGPTHDRHTGLDLYYLRRGHLSLTTDNGRVDLVAGDTALLSTHGPFEAHSDDFEMLALGLPHSLQRESEFGRKSSTCRKIGGQSGLGSCLGGLLSAIATSHAELTAGEGGILQTAILDVLGYLSVGLEEEPGPSPRHRDKLREVKALALPALSDPDLSPERLAREAAISVRTLHRLFHLSGITFGGWLREARLRRCWRDLTDSTNPVRAVAAVAFGWGFRDLRTFNRAFLALYGLTPNQAQRHSRNTSGS